MTSLSTMAHKLAQELIRLRSNDGKHSKAFIARDLDGHAIMIVERIM